jgi:hypothetical protein
VRISRFRLSEKGSRCRPREIARPLGKADEAQHFVQRSLRKPLGPRPQHFVLGAQPLTQPLTSVLFHRPSHLRCRSGTTAHEISVRARHFIVIGYYRHQHRQVKIAVETPSENKDTRVRKRKLLPGEWIFVRARQKVESYEEWWWTKIKDSSPLNVRVSASLMLNKVTYSPGEKSDSAMDRSVCIPLDTKLGTPSDVVLWPATSK